MSEKNGETLTVATAVGKTLAELGVGHGFGVVGSGNFHVTNALRDNGVPFVQARHENGAACMADAFARLSGTVGVLTVHQGCGLTNAITGIGEAAKSHTPMIVLAADTPAIRPTSNFAIRQRQLAEAVGAVVFDINNPKTAVETTIRAFSTAVNERCTVVINLPLDVQDKSVEYVSPPSAPRGEVRHELDPNDAAVLASLIEKSERPVFIGGRGALDAGPEIRELAEASGALLASSGVTRGLFVGDVGNLDVSGGFSTPLAEELISGADLIVSFGASLNRWTTKGGSLLRNATVVQIDDRTEAFGLHRSVDLTLRSDSANAARQVREKLSGDRLEGYRNTEILERISTEGTWASVPYTPVETNERLDPRDLSIAVNEILPTERIVVTDGGNFNGYPAMFLDVPDEKGYVLPLAFQSIGLSLASAIGASFTQPHRITVAGVGDGGFLMSVADLETAVRLEVPLVVLVYNDAAYGAEVHHFVDDDLTTVVFPETDIAALARGFGCDAVTVRSTDDLGPVRDWVAGDHKRPLVIDAKITSFPSWLLAHSFEED